MPHPTPSMPLAAEPVELLLLAALATLQALTVLLVAAAALLLALWPAAPAAPAPAPTAPLQRPASPERVSTNPPPADSLAGLRVVELRALARAAGLRQLARSGRRAQLLAALQPA